MTASTEEAESSEGAGERAITRRFIRWFKSEYRGSACVEQFKIQERKIDLCTFWWQDDVQLECWGVECKPKVTVSNIFNYFEQVGDYHESFPTIYLLTGSLQGEESLKSVCEASGIGLYLAPPSGDVRCVSNAGVRKFDEREFSKVRNTGAALLSFTKFFPQAEPRSWGAYTEGDVQFNVSFDDSSGEWRLGTNVENVHSADVHGRWGSLSAVVRGLPEDGLVRVWKHTYTARQRGTIPILTMAASEFDGESVLRHLGKVKKEAWHMNISLPLWSAFELLTKPQHLSRLESAKEMLTPIFERLGGRPQ